MATDMMIIMMEMVMMAVMIVMMKMMMAVTLSLDADFVFLSPCIITHCQLWIPDQPAQSKKISNDQELIQSDPTSCPQNQKGNN